MNAIEITWLGHSCFKIKGKDITIITDPYDATIGYPSQRMAANIVTSSHAHPGHGFTSGVDGAPRVVRGPGEYEIGGVFINGISTFHDAEGGSKRGKNTVFLIQMEGLTLCHLGDLGHTPTTAQVHDLSGVDVLFVPVGGVSTINTTAAAETVRLLQPKCVIPMHFHNEALRFTLEPVDGFLKEMGVKADLPPEPRLVVNVSNLGEETSVVLFDISS